MRAINLTDYYKGLEVGTTEGWISALDWVTDALENEIAYCEENPEFYSSPIYALDRMNTLFSHRRKEWMLSGE